MQRQEICELIIGLNSAHQSLKHNKFNAAALLKGTRFLFVIFAYNSAFASLIAWRASAVASSILSR